MFNWFFDICETSYNPQLNNNAPYIYAIMDKPTRTAFINNIKTEGVIFTTPIVQVQISAINMNKSTELTTIICDDAHYCVPGSNVTITGLLDSINGEYKNGVSLWYSANDKKDNINIIPRNREICRNIKIS